MEPLMAKSTDTTSTTPAAKVAVKCACGCDMTVSPGRTWLPGHDARAAGVAALAALAGDPTLIAKLPGEALQIKATALAAKWTATAEAKVARAAERAAAKVAK